MFTKIITAKEARRRAEDNNELTREEQRFLEEVSAKIDAAVKRNEFSAELKTWGVKFSLEKIRDRLEELGYEVKIIKKSNGDVKITVKW